MKIKVSELTKPMLNWAVAKCEGMYIKNTRPVVMVMVMVEGHKYSYSFQPTSDWSQGGPIIQRERIAVSPTGQAREGLWQANLSGNHHRQESTSPLIAAMRCYVASKLGDEIDIPEELL